MGSERKIRVVYVSPWAHRAGHYPQAVLRGTAALRKAGAEINLCTFQGILDYEQPETPPHRTVRSNWVSAPLGFVNSLLGLYPRTTIMAKLIEDAATFFLALRIKRSLRYDVIYLSDGDPFIFIPILYGLVVKGQRWAIVLNGQMGQRAAFKIFPYKFVIAPSWKPFYKWSLARNQIIFFCQNRYMKDYFEKEFLGGVLAGRVKLLPRGLNKAGVRISRREARQRLGLPEKQVILLHFGAVHLGKDIKTVITAIRDTPGILLVVAGEITAAVNVAGLIAHHDVQEKVILRDYYIPEEEKKYYFDSADAIILSYKKDFVQTASMLWEAASFTCPVIASDSGDLGTLVEKYHMGFVFEAEDPDSLRAAITWFMRLSESEKKDLASNGEKLADDFSSDVWAQRCIEYFIEIRGLTRKE